MKQKTILRLAVMIVLPTVAHAGELQRVEYRNPGLVVDLGVGLWAWPLPLDYDEDGDLDLLVSCPDVPYGGTYFFENPGGDAKLPVFKPAVRLGAARRNIQASYPSGAARLLVPGIEVVDFRKSGFGKLRKIYPQKSVHSGGRIRANQWKYADVDADGRVDLVVGVGDWSDYGWDDAFDSEGRWTRGPLHGYVYWLRNVGSQDEAKYADPRRLQAGGRDIDVFGMPSPNLADFDGDGDLDLLCGEFLDGFTYFENQAGGGMPDFAAGHRLQHDRRPLRMDLQMIVPVAIDWDRDGDVDLVVGDEDGRVALVEHTGNLRDGLPQFRPPQYFRQQARDVKFGALVTPVSFDWDGDGDEDLLCGNTAGYIGLIENLDSGDPPRFAAPRRLHAGGEVLRITAGPNGSIQGPCEAKWGYTTLSVADWDHDSLPDLVVNSIWGRVVWYRNIGTRREPVLSASQKVRVRWPSAPPKPAWNWWNPERHELATQWRTTPLVADWDKDGLNDLVMLDHEGYLAWFRRTRIDGELWLLPGRRSFVDEGGKPLRLNANAAGRSGRRKLCLVDWDRDGRRDLLVNSASIDWYRNLGERDGNTVLKKIGPLARQRLAGHTTSPTTVDWNGDGRPELLIGAEDGHLYYLPHSDGD